MTELVGTAEHYSAFVKLCRLRIEQLGITYETVDAIAGFPARYTSILLSGGKAMSVYSFFTMARALALLPHFHHDREQFALLSGREDWIKLRRNGARWRSKIKKRKIELGRDFLRNRAVLGGLIRARKLTAPQRHKIAQKAVAARKWRPLKVKNGIAARARWGRT